MRFTVTTTWDGQPLPPSEYTHLTVRRDGDVLHIEVDAPFHGNPPPPGPPGPTPKLWEHEVVELFVVGPDQKYLEIELSPYGHHLVLQLDGIRNIVASELPLDFTATRADGRWRGTAALSASYLPEPALTCNVFRVAGAGPTRLWQALEPVPGERPDFHRLQYFRPWPLA
jgi:hypothetical protein